MGDIGKLLMVVGGLVFVAGFVFLVLSRSGIPLGKLPGDIVYRGKNTTVYFPIVTSIVLSVVLSLVLYLISRFRQ